MSAPSDSQRQQVERLTRLLRNAQLQGTRVGAQAGHAHPLAQTQGSLDLQIEYGIGLLERTDDGRAVFGLTVKIATETLRIDGDGPALLIEVLRIGLYSGIPNDVTDDDLRQFAQGTVMLNLWPFLREDVYSQSTRLQVGPVVLPLAKPQHVMETEASPGAPEEDVARGAPALPAKRKRRSVQS